MDNPNYTPTDWETGDVITAELLNKAENGIAKVTQGQIENTMDITAMLVADNAEIAINDLSLSLNVTQGAIDKTTGEDVAGDGYCSGMVFVQKEWSTSFENASSDGEITVYWYTHAFGTVNSYLGCTSARYGEYLPVPDGAQGARIWDENAETAPAVTQNSKYYKMTRKRLEVASSTSGSTKRFAITVNDSGTITATEI